MPRTLAQKTLHKLEELLASTNTIRVIPGDLLLPERWYYDRLRFASRSAFYRWSLAGLKVEHIEGCRWLTMDTLREFLRAQAEKGKRRVFAGHAALAHRKDIKKEAA